MEVLHDWPDKQCGAILSAIRHAAPDNNATVLVVEDLMHEEQSDPRASTLDVIMLTMNGGCERTADQLRNLFEGAVPEPDKPINVEAHAPSLRLPGGPR